METFWLGVVSGVPLMIAVGPIAVLLVELGVGRGLRSAWPAAVGVALADLTYASLAALCGATLQRSLHPYAATMQLVAAGVLLAMAAVMFRRSLADLRQLHPQSHPRSVSRFDRQTDRIATRNGREPATGVRLALTMTGLTLANPLTVAAFTSLVVATGERASNLGWPLGIATASAVVHLGLVAGGSALRRALPASGPAVLRLCGATFISLLAANLLAHV